MLWGHVHHEVVTLEPRQLVLVLATRWALAVKKPLQSLYPDGERFKSFVPKLRAPPPLISVGTLVYNALQIVSTLPSKAIEGY